MAKKDKAAKADTKGNDKKSKADKEEKVAAPEFKYGVEDIAEKLDLKPASVRVQLRNKGIEKAGKSYGWNTDKELKEVIAQLKSTDDDADEKPAKKTKAKAEEKPAKKSKKKDKSDD